jgi:hypothetical protein
MHLQTLAHTAEIVNLYLNSIDEVFREIGDDLNKYQGDHACLIIFTYEYNN